MTKEQKLALMYERVNKMTNLKTTENQKCPGVLRALKREIRNMEASV